MRPVQYAQSLALASIICSSQAQKVIDLSNNQWTLTNSEHDITVPGSVPGQVHLDLFREGVIPDPYFELGDFELRWVTYANWTYETALDEL